MRDASDVDGDVVVRMLRSAKAELCSLDERRVKAGVAKLMAEL